MVSRAPIQIEGGGFGFFNTLATLNHDGARVATRQVKGREHAGWSEAYHYRAKSIVPLRVGDDGGGLRLADVCFLQEMLVFVRRGQTYLIIKHHPVFLRASMAWRMMQKSEIS